MTANHDVQGTQLYTKSNKSPMDCATDCNKLNDCLGFVHDSNTGCWLKNNITDGLDTNKFYKHNFNLYTKTITSQVQQADPFPSNTKTFRDLSVSCDCYPSNNNSLASCKCYKS